jgi:hypothetical protein
VSQKFIELLSEGKSSYFCELYSKAHHSTLRVKVGERDMILPEGERTIRILKSRDISIGKLYISDKQTFKDKSPLLIPLLFLSHVSEVKENRCHVFKEIAEHFCSREEKRAWREKRLHHCRNTCECSAHLSTTLQQ